MLTTIETCDMVRLVKYKIGFEKEMTDAGVNYRLIKYPGAMHGFTNPDNKGIDPPGALYNEAADKASWIEMQKFFKEIFS